MRASIFAVATLLSAAPAAAQLAVSANDAKVKMVNGVVQTVKDGKDTVAIIDLGQNPPKLLAEVEAPASVVGPPVSVAVSPNETLALVTAAEAIDPADPTKRVPSDKVTVIDLSPLKTGLVERAKRLVGKASATAAPPPKVLATLTAGKGAAGVSFNKAGTLALVANRGEGTVSIFTVAGTTVTPAGKVDFGNPNAGPSAIVFTPDGKQALVTLDGESANRIAVLSIDGNKVEVTKRSFNAGIRPYGIDITKAGDVAVVANIGRSQGDADTMSIIDLKAPNPRVANTVTVGATPEGIKISPDGKYIAVTLVAGTNLPDSSPFAGKVGTLQIWQRSGTGVTRVADAPIGRWCQGIAWSKDSKTVLAQCMVEEEIFAFRFSGITSKSLQKLPSIRTKGGPAGIRTAE